MLKMKMGASGRVTVRRLDKDKNEIQRLDFCNDLLKSGLDALMDDCMTGFPGGYLMDQYRWLFLGTGTTEPSPDDTGLESRSATLGGRQSTKLGGNTGEDLVNGVHWTERPLRVTYGEGEAEGVWTELGLAFDSSYSRPFSRALFRDETGAATSLTILSDEYLEITYTVRFYSGVGNPETQGSFTIGGVTRNFTLRTTGLWSSWTDENSYGSYEKTNGIMTKYFPFNSVAVTTDPNVNTDYQNRLGVYGGALSYGSWDAVNRVQTHSFTLGPTASDVTIKGFYATSRGGGWQGDAVDDSVINVGISDGGFVKKADYTVTFTLKATVVWWLDQIENVEMSAATATTLDFTWDAYPDATSYELELRDGSTVVATQTVTAPTLTASFTGLTASTDYKLDIRAVAPEWGSSRSIVPGSTTA